MKAGINRGGGGADCGYFLMQRLFVSQSTFAAMPRANNQTFPWVSRCKTEKARVTTTAATLTGLWQMILSPFLLISSVMTFPFKNTDTDKLWHELGSKRTTPFCARFLLGSFQSVEREMKNNKCFLQQRLRADNKLLSLYPVEEIPQIGEAVIKNVLIWVKISNDIFIQA